METRRCYPFLESPALPFSDFDSEEDDSDDDEFESREFEGDELDDDEESVDDFNLSSPDLSWVLSDGDEPFDPSPFLA